MIHKIKNSLHLAIRLPFPSFHRVIPNDAVAQILMRKIHCLFTWQISEVMTREMNIPVMDAKKVCDTFLKQFRRCPENPRMALDEWRELLWVEALGEVSEDYEEVSGMKKKKKKL